MDCDPLQGPDTDRVVALILLTLAACDGDTATRDSVPPEPYRVVELEDCRAGQLDDTECRSLEVTCEGLEPLRVDLRISHPPEGVTPVRTVLLGSGGGGDYHWTNSALQLGQLQDRGWTVVDRNWNHPWMTGEAGFVPAGCRLQAVITWLHHELGDDGPLCATGNSMGASELAQALTAAGGTELDGAVLASGPPLTRMDWACVPDSDPTWAETCRDLTEGVGVCLDDEQFCSMHDKEHSGISEIIDLAFEGSPCTEADPEAVAAFQAESTWPLDGEAAVPVPAEILLAADDCSGATPMAALYSELSGVPVSTVDGASHTLQNTQAGLDALIAAVERVCPAE